jgi:hypothetical protein
MSVKQYDRRLSVGFSLLGFEPHDVPYVRQPFEKELLNKVARDYYNDAPPLTSDAQVW